MIRRSTWVTLIILAALVGLVFYLQRNKQVTKSDAQAFPTAANTTVFGAEEGLPTSFEIQSSTGQDVSIAHNMQKAWVVQKPIEADADQGLVEAAATQISALRVLNNQIDLGLDVVGLDHPAYTITISFTGGKQHVLQIGAETPTQVGYYATVDNGKVMIVDAAGITSLLNLLTTPPYQQTLTPSPLPPTETLAAPQETPTPADALSTPTP